VKRGFPPPHDTNTALFGGGGDFFEHCRDVDFLRALLFAQTAGDAGRSLLFFIHTVVGALKSGFAAADFKVVVGGEVAGDIHSDRAGHAVTAGGAEDYAGFLVGIDGGIDHLLFRRGKGFESGKGFYIVFKMFCHGHAGEDAQHIGQRTNIAERP